VHAVEQLSVPRDVARLFVGARHDRADRALVDPDRLADLDRRGEMYDGLRFVCLQNFVEFFSIPDIAGLERSPFDKFRMAIREVVIDDRLKPLVEEVEAGMCADVTGSTSDKNIFHLPESPEKKP